MKASEFGVSYVPLEGMIGVITSGAGLGMASMDMLYERGLPPANFLDTGGGISEEMLYRALKLILEPSEVKGCLINLYGGINRMKEAAKGIAKALEETGDKRIIVAKILGNQQEEAAERTRGKQLLHVGYARNKNHRSKHVDIRFVCVQKPHVHFKRVLRRHPAAKPGKNPCGYRCWP